LDHGYKDSDKGLGVKIKNNGLDILGKWLGVMGKDKLGFT